MNGPQHYIEAERLLTMSREVPLEDGHAQYLVGAAQVHATLAQAAAVVDTGSHLSHSEAWHGALS